MPLRLLEVTLPSGELEEIPALLGDSRVIQVWTSNPEKETGLVRVLLDVRDTEALSDLLVRHFGSQADFRIVLTPVEATLPPVAEPSNADAASGGKTDPAATGPQRISREELYEDLAEASRLTAMYVVMVALSTVVAAVGLIRGDVAIVIGAMVIAPLLGPNIGLSLACTLGDPELAKRSLKAIAVGVGTAATLSILVGLVLTVDPSGPEIVSRSHPGVGDILLGLAAGAAGSLAFTSGAPAVVVGVMVAVALLPPLVVAGLLIGSGHTNLAVGPLVLMLINVTCLNLASVATFLIQQVRPRTWWETDRAKKATRIAVSTWVIMLGVLLGLVLSGRVGGI